MRRQITLIKPERQQGYALFIVLMMMVVIALLVVTATQSYNTEQRISTNDADRKFATTLAERHCVRVRIKFLILKVKRLLLPQNVKKVYVPHQTSNPMAILLKKATQPKMLGSAMRQKPVY